jgi:hypothetical protein
MTTSGGGASKHVRAPSRYSHDLADRKCSYLFLAFFDLRVADLADRKLKNLRMKLKYIFVSCFLDVSPSQHLRKWPEIQRVIESLGGMLPPQAYPDHDEELGVDAGLDHLVVPAGSSNYQTTARIDQGVQLATGARHMTCEAAKIRISVAQIDGGAQSAKTSQHP